MSSTTLTPRTSLTTGEAAERLGVSTDTVRRYADLGVLRAIRLTPRSPRRFRAEDVDRLIEQPYGDAA